APPRSYGPIRNPITAPQLEQLIRRNNRRALNRDQVHQLLARWYVMGHNHAGVGNCMFGAISIAAYGDSRHGAALRLIAAAQLDLQRRDPDGSVIDPRQPLPAN